MQAVDNNIEHDTAEKEHGRDPTRVSVAHVVFHLMLRSYPKKDKKRERNVHGRMDGFVHLY